MLKTYHSSMTTSAVGAFFSRRALDVVLSANLGQDSLLNLLKSRFHFDANAFEDAFAYVESLEHAIDRALASESAQAAWEAFGRLTHAVQDYYAHTNYVELWLEARPGYRLTADNPVDPLDRAIMDSDRLTAARVYYPLEALTIFPALVPALKKRLPSDSHANMNLDSPDSGPLFPYAISAAEQRTRVEFEALCGRISARFGEDALRLLLDR